MMSDTFGFCDLNRSDNHSRYRRMETEEEFYFIGHHMCWILPHHFNTNFKRQEELNKYLIVNVYSKAKLTLLSANAFLKKEQSRTKECRLTLYVASLIISLIKKSPRYFISLLKYLLWHASCLLTE